ncbi:MAG: hypothetical protein U0792_15625 [Gemmataceae bacterium]
MATTLAGPPVEAGLRALPELIAESEGWAAVRAALSAGHSGTIDGAWGSSAALAIAALQHDTPGTLLVVLANPADVSPWVEDIAGFTGARPAVFPAWETWPVGSNKGMLDPTTAARLRMLHNLSTEPPKVLVTTMAAVCQPVPERSDLANRGRKLSTAEIVEPTELAEWLVDNGYKRVDAVEYPGEFARRGGILDVFSPDTADPVRLEFFGDEIESIRVFAAGSQRSLEKRPSVTLLSVADPSPKAGGGQNQKPTLAPPSLAGKGVGGLGSVHRGFLTDYLPAQSWVALIEPGDLKEQAKHFFDRIDDATGLFVPEAAFANLLQLPNVTVTSLPRPSVEASAHLRVESVEKFSGNVQRVRDELDAVATGDTQQVLIACQSDAEAHRLTDVLKAGKLSQSDRLRLVTGHVRAGFRLVTAGIVVIGSHEIFHKDLLPPGVKAPRGKSPSRQIESRAIDSFLDLNEGDYVVHVAHGIARFRGMKMLETRNSEFERGMKTKSKTNPRFLIPHSALRIPHLKRI